MPAYHIDAAIDVVIDARDEDSALERFFNVFYRDDSSFCVEPTISVLHTATVDIP